MSSFADLGFSEPHTSGTYIERVTRVDMLSTETPVSYASYASDVRDRVMELKYDFQGQHVGWRNHLLSFTVRVPNGRWYRAPAPPGIIPSQPAVRFMPETTLANSPFLEHAHRLFKEVQVLCDGQIVYRQSMFNYVSEIDMWLNNPNPLPILGDDGFRVRGAGGENGIDLCTSRKAIEQLYSTEGLPVTMKLPGKLFDSKAALWPKQRVVTVRFIMETPVKAFQMDSYVSRPDDYEAAPPIIPDQEGTAVVYSDLSPEFATFQNAATGGAPRPSAVMYSQYSRLFDVTPDLLHYDILDAKISLDIPKFSEGAERAIAAAEASEGLPITYNFSLTQLDEIEYSTVFHQLRTQQLCSNARAMTTVFTHSSMEEDMYFDSFSFRNPALLEAQWARGDKLFPIDPLNSPVAFVNAMLHAQAAKPVRMDRSNFLGDLSYKYKFDPQFFGTGIISYTPSSSFMLRRDLTTGQARGDPAIVDGVTLAEDKQITLNLKRSAVVPTASSKFYDAASFIYPINAAAQQRAAFVGLANLDGTYSSRYVVTPDIHTFPASLSTLGIGKVYPGISFSDPTDVKHFPSYTAMLPLMNLRSRFSTGVYNYLGQAGGFTKFQETDMMRPTAQFASFPNVCQPFTPQAFNSVSPFAAYMATSLTAGYPIPASAISPGSTTYGAGWLAAGNSTRGTSMPGVYLDICCVPRMAALESRSLSASGYVTPVMDSSGVTASSAPDGSGGTATPASTLIQGAGRYRNSMAPITYCIPDRSSVWQARTFVEVTALLRFVKGGSKLVY